MKVTLVGGGGFRSPLVWESVAEVAGIERLTLHDISRARLERIAAVIEGLRRERGGGPEVGLSTDLQEAVEGAAAVFCAIRVGGLEGRVLDETIPLRHGVLGQETVGPGGVSFALRTVPVMLGIARTVAALAPGAWFVNFTNPAGLVTEALRAVLGERVVGICDSPEALFARVARALRRPKAELAFDYAGINHLGWLLAARDGNRDLLPSLLEDGRAMDLLEEGRLFGPETLRRLGMVPNEYLVYLEHAPRIVEAVRRAGLTRGQLLARQQKAFYSSPAEEPDEALRSWRSARDARFGTYMAEAWAGRDAAHAYGAEIAATPGAEPPGDDAPDEGPGEAGYAAVAAAFLRAVLGGEDCVLTLNVANGTSLPFLPQDSVVEVPCRVSPTGPRALAVGALPEQQAALVAGVKGCEQVALRAALQGSRALALEALVAHPLVGSREQGERILEAYLDAFPDVASRLA